MTLARRVSALFAEAQLRRRSAKAVLFGVVAVTAGTALSLLRHPGTVALDTVWAEDGTIFLAGAAGRSPVAALTTSYAGYYHLVPRLLAEIAAAVPPSAAAASLALGAALVTAALAVLVYTASAGHLASPLARFLVSAPVVLAPLAQHDVPNTVANLHWPGLYAMFWLFVWVPVGRAGRIVAPVVLALIALSDILVLAFLPLALIRLAVRRDRLSAVLAAALGVGLVVQFVGLATGSSARDDIALSPVRWATGYVLRAVPAAVFGERWLPDGSVDARRLVLAAAAWLVLAATLVFAVRRARPRPMHPQWTLAAAAILQSVALYALPVVLTGVATPRYAFAPALLILVAAVALLERAAVPLAVLAVACLIVWAVNFRVDTERDDGPQWTDELERARFACATRGAAATVDVPIPPADAGWQTTVPCSYLGR